MRRVHVRGSLTLTRATGRVIGKAKIPCGNATQNCIKDDKKPCNRWIGSGLLVLLEMHAPKTVERNTRNGETMRVDENFWVDMLEGDYGQISESWQRR